MAEISTDIAKAKALLENNQLIGFPTETVYGLAGNALNEEAVVEIFKVKNRPYFDPLIIHSHSLEKIRTWVEEIPPQALALAEAFWPGPLTLLLEKKDIVPDLTTSGSPKVAVRIPNHALSLQLLASLDFPLAAPSANPFGYISPTTAQHVNDQLGDKIPFILDGGPSQIGIESTIIGFEEDQTIVYRLGGKALEEIERVAGKVQLMPHSSSNPQAPGMLKSHYAPKAKLTLLNDWSEMPAINKQSLGVLGFDQYVPNIPKENQRLLAPHGTLEEAARNLFSALRELDKLPISGIVTCLLPAQGLGRAINDRLKRAAAE
ncbi:L-threonylcarbamoyladenylate synthase [Cytophagales bacterium LB-30]|uniref:Threonylcarbamoyl-AMP synthase n=1 Tax=Shiella aurantiaca TaxID=3058365 RepID=A0ABT8F902_9BACT|nr:L-threonylcarbamoyladenylate synthase [Shiella aurantiaca]MDN4166951.1 L-threonylcarbamoyladenylate synthase [Shiella aurantiaca]